MGKLYVTGIGPGNEKGMTLRAREVLEECTVIVGYKTYIDLIRPLFDTEYAKEGCEEESSTEKNGTGTGRAEERSTGNGDYGSGSVICGKRNKEFIDTGMHKEVERCRIALDLASKLNESVAVVCSGDACIYGMAGIIYELSEEYPGVEIEVIPGVTAALSGLALLGAALGHDCALISLSDLLTPGEVIEKRLRCAADGDFAICLYNPGSKYRVLS